MFHEYLFFLWCTLPFSKPTLESCPGGVPKHTPFQSPDGFLARLSCGVPSQPPSHAGYFLPFRSSPTRISQTGLKVLQVTLRLLFGVPGRKSPTAGPGHSPRSNPSRLGSITPTLPNYLLEIRITSWQEISEIIFPLGRLSYKNILKPTSSMVTFPPELTLETSLSISKATTRGEVMIRRFLLG